MKELRNVVDSFNYAIHGIVYTVRTQRNMRIHLLTALGVLTACFFYDISKVELLILMVTITLVLFAEIVNTSIEAIVDMFTNNYHPLAKVAKDTAAGAVLITALNAAVVGYIVFWDKLRGLAFRIVSEVKIADTYLVLIIIILVCMITLFLKAILGEGTPLRGGMPSGHAAISFSIATLITLITSNTNVMVLSCILALIVAQSRVDSKVHTVFQVVVGALVGISATILIYKMII